MGLQAMDHSNESSERRRSERFPLMVKALARHAGGNFDVVLLSISGEGAMFDADASALAEIRPGEAVDLEVPAFGSFEGHCAWVDGYCCGVAFTDNHKATASLVRMMAERNRARMEDVLDRASELARFKPLLDAMVNAVVCTDDRGDILVATRTCGELFGFAGSELVGRNVRMLMPTETAAEHAGMVDTYLKTGEQSIIGTERQVTARHRNGDSFTIRLHLSETALDDRIVFVGEFIL